jgi:putative addiction module component (TIGR02574 family)
MILEQHPELRQLSVDEKLSLITELWDDLASHGGPIPVPDEQIAELDRRMAAYRKDPSQVTTWEAVKARILASGSSAA